MIRINKHLLAFTSIFLILGVVTFVVSQKFWSLLTHTVYYCQAFISSFSLEIPHNFRLFLPILAVLMSIIFMGKLGVMYFSVRRFKKSIVIKNKRYKRLDLMVKEFQLTEKVALVQNSKPFAFCLGIRKPKIYISSALLRLVTLKELKAILLHERSHLKNRDTTTMLLAKITESLLPFFPTISDLVHNFQIEREIKADEAAIRELGSSAPLRSVLEKLLVYEQDTDFGFVPAMGDIKTLEVRITTLMNKSTSYRKFKLVNLCISLLSIIILFLGVFAPVKAMELSDDKDNKQKDDVMMVCLSGGECHRWCKEHKTVIPETIAPSTSYLSFP